MHVVGLRCRRHQLHAGVTMPTIATLEDFITRVESNAHAEAVADFYTENASMQENNAAPRVGRDVLGRVNAIFVSAAVVFSMHG